MRLTNLLPGGRRRRERDLERELRYHLERRADELRADGLTEAEARRQATIEFGGIAQAQEEVRAVWKGQWIDTIARDVRYAARGLARRRGFTVAAVVSLALGIGATTAIFSLTDQLILRRLPVAQPDRLVQLAWMGNSLSASWGGGHLMSYPLCRELQAQATLFDGVFCRSPGTVNLSTGSEQEPVRGEFVSGSYFSVLGVTPQIGRLIDRSDDTELGASPVVVLSHGYWKNQLGGTPNVIGRKVLIDHYPMTVIGVAPATFVGVDPLAPPALWIPATMVEQTSALERGWNRALDRRTAWLHVFARLAPNARLAEVKPPLQVWFRRMLEEDTRQADFPQVTAERREAFLASSIDVMPAGRGVSNLRLLLNQPLRVLMGGTLVLLLLASLNVGGLLLARGAARSGELATRMAMGASRRQLAGQLLVESTLLTAAGGALGVLVAPVLSTTVLSYLTYADDIGVSLDARALLFALLTTGIAAALCGLAPMFQMRRVSLQALLKQQSRSATAGGGLTLRKALVVAQMALTLVLLVSGGLFVQTLARLHANVGFDAGNLVVFSLAPPSLGYSEQRSEQTMRNVLRRVTEMPGVSSAAVANTLMLSGGWSTRPLTIQSDARVVSERPVPFMRVTPGFFSALGARVKTGRDFDSRDVRAAGTEPRPWRTAIVNESFARRYFGGRNPVGYRIGVGDQPDVVANIEIIGMVSDFSRRSLRDTEIEQVFFPYWDRDADDGAFYVRVRGTTESTFAAIRAAVREVDAELTVGSLRMYREQIDRAAWTERALATLASGFAVIALVLSVVGVYGLMSFIVTQRRREIGLRLALGSTRAGAVRLILWDAVLMVAIGVAIALPSVWALRRLVETQLFGVSALDVPTLVGPAVALALVALLAALGPALRAALANPTEALRLE